MIRVFGHQHLSQQSGCRDTLVDHLRWYRCLDQGLALVAGPFAPDVALHRELARDVIQLLTDVLADTLELAAALALGIVRFVVDQGTWQFRWQRSALGFLLWPGRFLLIGHHLFKLGFDRRQVTVDQLIQQLALNRIELLTAAGVLVTLEDGHFVSQLLDDRITVHQSALLVLDSIEQFRGKSTELIGRELVEIGVLSHAAQYAKSLCGKRFAVLAIAALRHLWLQDGDNAVGPKALPGQALNQGG